MSTPALPAGMQVFERGWLSSNNILFCGPDENVLMDTGYVQHAPQTLQLLQHALQGAPLHRIINTHLHSDHCGGNALLQAHFGCEIQVPLGDSALVRAWDEARLSFRATGQSCERFDFDSTLQAGDTIKLGHHSWQALAAPGHDPHTLVFYCAQEKILISADALWQRGFGVIFPELKGEPGFAETRATLDLIASLEVKLVIPGHGAIFSDCAGALAYAYTRLNYLEAEPLRNAYNALKVLLKFLLLERQSVPLAQLPQFLTSIPMFVSVNQNFMRQEPEQLAQWAATQLVSSGAAKIEDDCLRNLD